MFAKVLLRCTINKGDLTSGWLLKCCYVVAKVFKVVTRVLL